MQLRTAGLTLTIVLAIAACDQVAVPGLPEPTAEVLSVGTGEMVGGVNNLVRRRATSPRLPLVIGRDYILVTGHCGLSMPMDVDRSFWVPVVEPENGVPFEAVTGIFRLENEVTATLTVESGHSVRLGRVAEHSFRRCM